MGRAPLKYNDPSGHYGADVHQGGTTLWGQAVIERLNDYFSLNVDRKFAGQIAEANVYTYNNPATWPLNQNVGDFQAYGEASPVHTTPSEYYHLMGQDTAEKRLSYAISAGNPELFGQALHLYQDTFSHIESGFSYPGGEKGIQALHKMCRGCYGKSPGLNQLMDKLASSFIGHV